MTARQEPLESSAAFLAKQYSDSENFRVRVETHRLYSERTADTFNEWLLAIIDGASGSMLADVGCGPGLYHAALARKGVRVVALDLSPGMVREAREQATAEAYALDVLVASAEHLPLPTAVFDRVMANHMLYHVPDQPRALAEIHRIAKPGARVVMATNAADNIRRLYDVHEVACASAGYVPANLEPLRFNLEHLPLVRSEFPDAEMILREDALLFTDADGPTRYYASYLVDSIADRPADDSHREPLVTAFRWEVAAIIARDGVFRVPKSAGCFVATA